MIGNHAFSHGVTRLAAMTLDAEVRDFLSRS